MANMVVNYFSYPNHLSTVIQKEHGRKDYRFNIFKYLLILYLFNKFNYAHQLKTMINKIHDEMRLLNIFKILDLKYINNMA